MVRLRMWDTGTGCGRASWTITRARQSRLHLNTVMVMAANKAMVVVDISLLLPRNSGPSEEMDVITAHHKQHSGSFAVGSHGFHETSYGIWGVGDKLL
jgi:hypothetical protein